MAIIGTAGHVDHGKSTLVHALTGIDPDRLAEEKRRGMTIDLGFAHIDLPSGERVGVVDVPGHVRFLHNMLSGVHGIDVVLLVVAADEGVMPQTREHLDILELMDARRLVLALTKVDLVDAEWLPLVKQEVEAELARRGFADVSAIAVSVPRGQGIEEVRAALTELVAQARIDDEGRPRLPIDRSFTMPGFGTVVTGSLVDGSIVVGQELELAPPTAANSHTRLRVRGLQQHGRSVERAMPGTRVAVNLAGIEHEALHRGQVLALAGTLSVTTRVDVRLRILDSASVPLKHNARLRVFAGTAETAARARVLGVAELSPGSHGWVQLRLTRPLALREGDRVVVRRASPGETLGGGRVIDVAPPVHRRLRAGLLEALEAREKVGGRLRDALERAPKGITREEVIDRLGVSAAVLSVELQHLISAGEAVMVEQLIYASRSWNAIETIAQRELAAFHRNNPARVGLPREALRNRLGLSARAFPPALAAMLARGRLEVKGEFIALAGRAAQLTAAEQRAVESALQQLRQNLLSPPGAAELAAAGLSPDLRRYLEESGLAVRLGADVLVVPEALHDAEARLRAYLEQHGEITVAQARDVLGSSRRVVVPLLEHLDATHLTRREGDVRKLR